MLTRAASAVVALAFMATLAHGQAVPEQDRSRVPIRASHHPRDIPIEIPGERTTTNKIILAAIAGAALVAGGIGLYYHLDSRSTASDITQRQPTGIPWSPELQAVVDTNESDRHRALIGYSIAGGIAVGLAAFYIATYPKSTTTVLHTTAFVPTLAPATGGATVGAAWQF